MSPRFLVALPLAVLGSALGVASILGEWSRVVLQDGATAPAWTFASLKIFSLPYAVGLIAMLVMAAATLFGPQAWRRRLRVAGLVVCGLSLALLAIVASMFQHDYGLGELYYRVNSSYDQDQVLSWGVYAAFGALIALGAALVTARGAGVPGGRSVVRRLVTRTPGPATDRTVR